MAGMQGLAYKMCVGWGNCHFSTDELWKQRVLNL